MEAIKSITEIGIYQGQNLKLAMPLRIRLKRVSSLKLKATKSKTLDLGFGS